MAPFELLKIFRDPLPHTLAQQCGEQGGPPPPQTEIQCGSSLVRFRLLDSEHAERRATLIEASIRVTLLLAFSVSSLMDLFQRVYERSS